MSTDAEASALDAQGIRCPAPRWAITATLALIGIGVLGAYETSGCQRDWAVIGGVVLNAAGTLGIAAVEIPRQFNRLYLHQLDELDQALSALYHPADELAPETQLWLIAFLDEFRLSDEPVVTAEVDGEEVRVYEADCDSPTETMRREVVATLLRRRIDVEERRWRWIGISLLGIGFGVQVGGLLYNGTVSGLIC